MLLTERCTVSCNHCWFSCGPERTGTMTLETAKQVIDEATGLGAEWVSFTGGEPFLVYHEMKELIGYAADRGLLKEAVTNCHWAETEETAQAKLTPLVEAGLDVLNISVDDFHQDNIPLMNVRNCFNAAKRLDLKMVLMIAVAKNSVITVKNISELLMDASIQVLGEPRISDPSALVIETAFTPVGRGAEIPRENWYIDHGKLDGVCPAALKDIGVKPNGDVMPCCGPLSLKADATLGNINDASLETLLTRALNDERFKKITKRGLEGSTGRYVNRCHLCFESW
ncbi:MAG: radical SAM protein [Candidatus Bathyarchaeota archaeon]|nr:radical SAM protein [Candidatus Bathyarchaeota archaeon]